MKSIVFNSILVFLTLSILTGCSSKRYNLLGNMDNEEGLISITQGPSVPTIGAGHELCILVTDINEESAQYFRASSEREGATGIECLRYRVRESGEITLPLLGDIKVAGYSVEQCEMVIRDTLLTILKGPAVTVEMINHNVTILGEVANPGIYNFPTGKATIFDAVARAGGLHQFAERTNVLVTRQSEEGVKHIRLDLTSDQVIRSKYYYLHKDDMIYIESKAGRIAQSKNWPQWGTVLVGLGTVAAIIATRPQ
jgi:polysaccharide export outer membrane protein